MLHKHHTVVKILRNCLTRRINLNSLTRNYAFQVLLLGAALGLAGCATVQPQSAEQIVKAKAQARWDAMVRGDLKVAYGYMSPGSRSVMTLAAFEGSVRKGFWKSVVVEGVNCSSADTCDVVATVEYTLRGAQIRTPHRETWIREGSEWWYLRK